MKKKFSGFIKGEICAAVVLILLGLCLTFIPVQTVGVICKIVFGVMMMAAGCYLIFNYLNEKKETTVLELFSGTITFILGGFLIRHPQIVVKILPLLLGALIIVDSFWIVRSGLRLKKAGDEIAVRYLGTGALFTVLGIFIMLNLFKKFSTTLLFSGIILIAHGAADIVLYIISKKHPAALLAGGSDIFATEETNTHFGEAEDTTVQKPAEDEYEEYDPSYGFHNEADSSGFQTGAGEVPDPNGNVTSPSAGIHLELPGKPEDPTF